MTRGKQDKKQRENGIEFLILFLILKGGERHPIQFLAPKPHVRESKAKCEVINGLGDYLSGVLRTRESST